MSETQPNAGETVTRDEAHEVHRLLRVLEQKNKLTRRALVLLVADEAKLGRQNWAQKKQTVEHVFALAEAMAAELKL